MLIHTDGLTSDNMMNNCRLLYVYNFIKMMAYLYVFVYPYYCTYTFLIGTYPYTRPKSGHKMFQPNPTLHRYSLDQT